MTSSIPHKAFRKSIVSVRNKLAHLLDCCNTVVIITVGKKCSLFMKKCSLFSAIAMRISNYKTDSDIITSFSHKVIRKKN